MITGIAGAPIEGDEENDQKRVPRGGPLRRAYLPLTHWQNQISGDSLR